VDEQIKGNRMGRACGTHGGEGAEGNLWGRDNCEHQSVDGSII